jgi:hypothetical protein
MLLAHKHKLLPLSIGNSIYVVSEKARNEDVPQCSSVLVVGKIISDDSIADTFNPQNIRFTKVQV